MSLRNFIKNAVAEDLGEEGDHTSMACIPESARGSAQLLVKEPGIIAGIEIAKEVFHHIDSSLKVNAFLSDGDRISPGDTVFTVTGSARNILAAERLSLNIMQRMSGIAAETRKYVDACKDTGVKILDTRKTTPGMRFLEKQAVLIGGGHNHRYGLYDYIMIKDNHIDYAGGIAQALKRVKEYLDQNRLKREVEIEARNLKEVEEIMAAGTANRIMLDNFSIEDTRKAVNLIGDAFEIESSGGITLETVSEYARCGVDYISVGALTHSVKSLDLSLKAR